MPRVRNLLKHGASFVVGVAAGAALCERNQETVYLDRDGDPFTPWQGPERKYNYDPEFSEDLLDYVDHWLEYDEMPIEPEYPNPFWKDDLRDFRREISHGLADVDEGEDIPVELHQRQRLLLYDLIIHGPLLSEIDGDE